MGRCRASRTAAGPPNQLDRPAGPLGQADHVANRGKDVLCLQTRSPSSGPSRVFRSSLDCH